MEPLLLQPESVEFAKDCLLKHGTNDLMPRGPFVPSVQANWSAVKNHLLQIDVRTYSPAKPRVVYSPKSTSSFRVSHSLDLIDFLVLSAIVHEYSNDIESWRSPRDLNRVHSNRVALSKDSFFETGTYQGYQQESKKLASMDSTKYVVTMDIVDCYNQISVHRVMNALQECSVPFKTCEAIERLLTRMNTNSSRGIPVGQEFSSLLAEVSLGSIDDILSRKGFTFVRYVDDYRVFCDSFGMAKDAVLTMTTLLNDDTQKLCLNDSKTRIYLATTFLTLESVDPDMRERSERFKRYRKKVSDALDWIQEEWDQPYSAPPSDEEELDKEFVKALDDEALQESIKGLFESALEVSPFDYQMIKHLLIRARIRRSSILLDPVIQNLAVLTPIFPFVCRYISAASTYLRADQKLKILHFLDSDYYGELEYIRAWILEMLFHQKEILTSQGLSQILTKWSSDDKKYRYALSSFERSVAWIRTDKEMWAQMPRDTRNWFIYASRLLPSGERNALWKQIRESGDLLDKCMLVWAKDQA